MKIDIRRMTKIDIDCVLKIQDLCYNDSLLESYETFQSILNQHCYIAELCGQAIGYLLSHPWNDDEKPPVLNTSIIDFTGNTIYLHDLAVHPTYRQHNIGTRLYEEFERNVKGYEKITLVAVNNSADMFWKMKGFVPYDSCHLSSYGNNAVYMKKTIVFLDPLSCTNKEFLTSMWKNKSAFNKCNDG